MNSHIVTINEIDLYYEEWNQPQGKETIVLIHGFLSSTFSFRKLAPLLIESFHVLSIDIPPFGKSGKSDTYHYSYENIAATILKFIEQLGYKEIYAAGHSMGGQIVLNMIYQRPDIIKKAILIGSSGYLPRAKTAMILLSYIPFIDKFIKHKLGKKGVLGNLYDVVYDRTAIDDTMISGYMEPFYDDRIFRALAKMLRHREGDLSSDILKQITTPCLLIWGEQDRVVPVHIGKRLLNDLPNSKLIILPKTGHLVPEEKPAHVLEEIKQFIGVSHPN